MAAAEDPPPTTTQPLLPKLFPSPPPSEDSASTSSETHHQRPAPTDPLQYPPVSFLRGPRSFRDLPVLLLFLLLSLASLSLGIFALAHRNPHFSRVSSFYFDPSSSSCVDRPSSLLLLLLPSFPSSSTFLKDLISTLVVTFLLCFPISLFLLWLLRGYAKQVVYGCVPFFFLIPAFLNVYWFVACTLSADCRTAFPLAYRILAEVFIFLLIGIVVWIIVVNWHRVELTVRIIQVAAVALSGNLWLFVVLPLLGLGAIVFVAVIVVFLVFATRNGEIVPRERDGMYYCVWKQDAWVPAYFALGILTILWVLATTLEAQVYVISGTVAQWYFCKEGEKPTRSIRNSLSHAFGPSFGTVCFSGLTMGFIRFIRAIIEAAEREESGSGIVNCILQCCANTLLAAVDYVNKFTVNFAAITGEAYCSSARMTYELLKRNLLSAVFVETVSTRILVGIILVLSALYAIVICAILKAVSALEAEAYLVTVLAWALLLIVLGFFVHVLDNVIDTVYICYAIDRDKGEVTKQEVHEVYVHLPISRSGRPSLALRRPLLV